MGQVYALNGAETILYAFGETIERRKVSGSSKWTIPLYRLDVDDVTTSTGAKVAGTFVLYRKQNGQWRALPTYERAAVSPTKRGLDLPAGDYKVVTSYTVDGAPQQLAEDFVTLP